MYVNSPLDRICKKIGLDGNGVDCVLVNTCCRKTSRNKKYYLELISLYLKHEIELPRDRLGIFVSWFPFKWSKLLESLAYQATPVELEYQTWPYESLRMWIKPLIYLCRWKLYFNYIWIFNKWYQHFSFQIKELLQYNTYYNNITAIIT